MYREGGEQVPLFHADTVVEISNNVALVTITQYFMNTSEETTEMQYVQPVHNDVVFCQLEI